MTTVQRSAFQQRASLAHRGSTLEKLLIRANAMYEQQGIARIEKREQTWGRTSASMARGLPPQITARTGDGYMLMRKKSDVDFTGCAYGRAVSFDAKETKENSIPLDKFTEHQVDKLCADEKIGGVAGFIVLFDRYRSAFWVAPSKVRAAQDLVRFQKGKGLHPKSLSLDWMKVNALLISNDVHDVGVLDWLPILGLEGK